MSLESTDIRRDTSSTPTRIPLECGEMSSGFGLSLDTPYNAYDTSYRLLSTGQKPDSDLLDTSFKTSTTVPMQHPWSDMVFDDVYMSWRQMTPGISLPSSNSSVSSYSSLSSPPLPLSSSLESACSLSLTHEYHTVFDKIAPSQKLYFSDLEPPSLAPDSPTPDSVVPNDAIRRDSVMTTISQDALYYSCGLEAGVEQQQQQDQDMSDNHDSDMDVDSDESNDEAEAEEILEGSSSQSSSVMNAKPDPPRTRAAARAASKAATANTTAPKTITKKTTNTKKAAPNSRKPKATSTSKSSTKTSSISSSSKGSSTSRKHHSPSDEESSDAKRQKFLERNRVAASKCREKKRLQTLKTIADADVITARNQALHDTLEMLQEEVRTLKNQILCHRDCGCDVIQKFVQSSYGTGTFMPNGLHSQAERSLSVSSESLDH